MVKGWACFIREHRISEAWDRRKGEGSVSDSFQMKNGDKSKEKDVRWGWGGENSAATAQQYTCAAPWPRIKEEKEEVYGRVCSARAREAFVRGRGGKRDR